MHWKLVHLAAVAAIGASTGTTAAMGFTNGTTAHPSGTGSSHGTGTTLSKTSRPISSTATSSSSIPSSTTASNPRAITAHTDGQCQKPVKTKQGQSFIADKGFPDFTTVNATSFPGAEAKTGGGYDVWWKIPSPGPGCRTQVMLPYAQSAGTPGQPGGVEIINVGKAGCFFGNIPTDSDILLSFCCGADNCQEASLNSTNLLASPHARRDLRTLRSDVYQESENKEKKKRAAAGQSAVITTATTPTAPTAQRAGSLAVRAYNALHERLYYPPPPPAPSDTGCVFAAGTPYSQAGAQVVVTDSLRCATAPCTFAVNQAISMSTTATSSTDQTITNSVGGSVTVTTGESLIESFSVAVSASYDFSKAISKTTGSSIMNGNSTTITSTVSVMLGNEGAVTFTPVYKCYVGPLNCGTGVSDPITVCQPDMLSSNGAPNGEYGAVTWG